MNYNLNGFTTVEQIDASLTRIQGKRNKVFFGKAEREAMALSKATTSPLIPGQLAGLQEQIEQAELTLAAAQSPLDITNAKIELASLQGEHARLTKRSLSQEPEDVFEEQVEIGLMEFQIQAYDEMITALQARRAELVQSQAA